MGVYRWGSIGKWVVDFQHRGERVRKVSPVQSERGAKRYEADLRAELGAGSLISKRSVPGFGEYALEWLDTYTVAAGNKYSEIVSKESILRNQLIPEFGRVPLDRIGPGEVREYVGRRPHLTRKTIVNHLAVLRRILRSAAEEELIPGMPLIKAPRTDKPDVDFLQPEERDALLEAARPEPEWYAMILFAVRTGLRQGELRVLRWADVDLKARTVRVRRARWQDHESSPKGRRERSVPIIQSVIRVMRQHAKRSTGVLVFPSQGDQPFSTAGMYYALHRACSRAGLRKIGWHALRHTLGTDMAREGCTAIEIMQVLGHTTLEMANRYIHLTGDAHLQRAMARLQPTREKTVSCSRSRRASRRDAG